MAKLRSKFKKLLRDIFHPMPISNESVPVAIKLWAITVSFIIWIVMLWVSTPFVGLLSIVYSLPMILVTSAMTTRLASPFLSGLGAHINIMYFQNVGLYTPTITPHIIAAHILFLLIAYFVSMLVYNCGKSRLGEDHHIRRARFLQNSLISAVENIPTEVESVCIKCNNIKPKDLEWMSADQYFSEYTKFKTYHDVCPTCRDEIRAMRGTGTVRSSGVVKVKISKKEADR